MMGEVPRRETARVDALAAEIRKAAGT